MLTTLLVILFVILFVLAAGAAFTWLYAWRVERCFPPTGRFMEVDGCRLHYREAGPECGEALGTVVLLHGALSNLAESMLSLGSTLASRYRVVAFDRPGHGWSGRKPDPAAAEPGRQAAVIAEALRRLQVRNAVVVGHSWSGTVVPNLALDHRDVTGAILILSGVTHPWPGGYVAWYDRLTASRLGPFFARTLAVPFLWLLRWVLVRKTFFPQQAPRDILRKAAIPLALRPGPAYANARDVAVMYDAVGQQSLRYGEIRVPAVAVAGDRDEIVWTDLHSRSFVRDVPGAELVVLPGVGHMPQYARPELILSQIEALAERIAPARVKAD